jgi:hypothetical protein
VRFSLKEVELHSASDGSLREDGDTVAIGAFANDGWRGRDSGHVRIYDWDGSVWTQRGSDIDGEAINDLSGGAVSLSRDGDTVAIGALQNDGNGRNSGHVRIYDWDGSVWMQRGPDIDGEAAGDWSGEAISLSRDGDTVAIGALQNDGNGSNSGHVRIYDWDGRFWRQRGSDIGGEAAGDWSGTGRWWCTARGCDGQALFGVGVQL